MTTTKRITETWTDPKSFGTNGLRYFQDYRNGKHVVVHEMNCGEDFLPNVYRYENIEEARKMWVQLRQLINKNGYTVKK